MRTARFSTRLGERGMSAQRGGVPDPEAEQIITESHTDVKPLPSRNFVCGR